METTGVFKAVTGSPETDFRSVGVCLLAADDSLCEGSPLAAKGGANTPYASYIGKVSISGVKQLGSYQWCSPIPAAFNSS